MNLFKDADTAESVIYQAIGAGSMCWESVIAAGVFDDVRARKVAEDAVERLRELGHDV